MSEQVVQQTVSVPAVSAALGQALEKVVLAAVAAHKAAPGAAVEVMEDAMEAVKDLGPVVGQLQQLAVEGAVDPIGVAQAFANAGLDIAKVLLASPSAPAAS